MVKTLYLGLFKIRWLNIMVKGMLIDFWLVENKTKIENISFHLFCKIVYVQ